MAVLKPFKPLDAKFPLERQLGIAAAPVALINLFTLDSADEAGFLDVFVEVFLDNTGRSPPPRTSGSTGSSEGPHRSSARFVLGAGTCQGFTNR
jgi:hypothetical protein